MTDKLLKTNLEQLIEKFSKTDVISHIEKNYKIENIKYVSYKDLRDNHFIKKIKYNKKEIDTIIQSIEKNGLYNPLIVIKPPKSEKYEVLIGRKRWVACKKMKHDRIPIIVSNYNEEESLLILLADSRENKNANPIEVASVVKCLNENFNYKKGDIARILHESSAQVSNYLSLLTLPEEVIDDVSTNKLSFGHAKAISRLSDDDILNIVHLIYEKNLSVRDTEALVQRIKQKGKLKSGIYITLEDNKIIIRGSSKTKISKALRIVKKSLKSMLD